MAEEKVKVLRGFDNQGAFVVPGQSITVSSVRAEQLELNGLVDRLSRQQKANQDPANKMSPRPSNKTKAPAK